MSAVITLSLLSTLAPGFELRIILDIANIAPGWKFGKMRLAFD